MDNVTGFTNTSKINQEAAAWILLIEDTPKLSKEQIAALNQWVATSDVHKECLTSMANSWGEMGLLASVMVPQELKARSNKARVQAWLLAPLVALMYIVDRVLAASTILVRPIIAAPIALVLIGWLAFSFVQPITLPANDTLLLTKIGQQSHHILEDGSIIWLNSNTEVKVDYSADLRRISLVKGEAHFEVAKDKNRPFEVYAGDRLVRAIGTAFSVYRLDDRIEVLVSEGKVELAIVDATLVIKPDNYDAITIAHMQSDTPLKDDEYSSSSNQQAMVARSSATRMLGELVAGQRVSIPTSNGEGQEATIDTIIEVDSSEITRKLSWREGKLVFAGESLEEVVREITRHTEIRIDVVDPALKKMRIGGQFQAGETDSLFYVLQSGFGISVNKVDENHVQLHVKEKIN
jgi:transmembrane sensor